ncbi:MAG TPA: Lpg1974 family pore-forming outer membrane protein [Rhizomicrobium sp.]|nr:Lpg1974 family pore-forming outer membrane protein [Rhizomicrobium sp.]
MSELVSGRADRAIIRKNLLATSSATILAACIASTGFAIAEESDRPTVWVELGGQMEAVQGSTSPFIAPFMTAVAPAPGPYRDDFLTENQRAPHESFGIEGKIVFQPEDSDWKFSAAIRYGRAHARRHAHNQTAVAPVIFHYSYAGYTGHATKYFGNEPFADSRVLINQSHAVLDFEAGKDVGLGIFGRESSSVVSAGVRFAQFSSESAVNIYARPSIVTAYAPLFGGIYFPQSAFHQYTMHANSQRSFRGIGPSLSWDASTSLFGNDHVKLTADWGINAALLFGRQKAKTSHMTRAYDRTGTVYPNPAYTHLYPTRTTDNPLRSRAIIVPNLGGFAGLSVKYSNAKVSFGYRADFFFGATDTGIDTRDAETLGFHGPFATVSVGLGG